MPIGPTALVLPVLAVPTLLIVLPTPDGLAPLVLSTVLVVPAPHVVSAPLVLLALLVVFTPLAVLAPPVVFTPLAVLAPLAVFTPLAVLAAQSAVLAFPDESAGILCVTPSAPTLP